MSERVGFEIATEADVKALDNFIRTLASLQESGGTLAEALSDMAGASKEGEESFGRLQQALTEVKRQEEDVEPAQRMMKALQDARARGEDLTTALNRLREEGGADFDALQKSAEEAAEGMEEAGSQSGSSFDGLLQKLPGFDTALRWIKTGLREVGQIATESFKRMAEEGDPAAIALQQSFANTNKEVDELIDSITRGLVPAATEASDDFGEMARTLRTQTIPAIQDANEKADNFIEALVEKLGMDPKELEEGFPAFFDQLGNDADWIQQQWDKLKGPTPNSDDIDLWEKFWDTVDPKGKVAQDWAKFKLGFMLNVEPTERETQALREQGAQYGILQEQIGRMPQYHHNVAIALADENEERRRAALSEFAQQMMAAKEATDQAAFAAQQDALAREWEASAIAGVAEREGELTRMHSSAIIGGQMTVEQVNAAIAAWKEEGTVSLQSLNQQMSALDQAILKYQATGESMPTTQADEMRTSIDQLMQVMLAMSPDEATKQALLDWFVQMKLDLDGVTSSANAASGAVSGVGGVRPGGSASPAPGASGDMQMAAGGTITEPIRGLGLRTGRRYLLGEDGDEDVVPRRNGRSMVGNTVNNNINISSGRGGRREDRRMIRQLVRELNWRPR